VQNPGGHFNESSRRFGIGNRNQNAKLVIFFSHGRHTYSIPSQIKAYQRVKALSTNRAAKIAVPMVVAQT
jgi:hypothetical protein